MIVISSRCIIFHIWIRCVLQNIEGERIRGPLITFRFTGIVRLQKSPLSNLVVATIAQIRNFKMIASICFCTQLLRFVSSRVSAEIYIYKNRCPRIFFLHGDISEMGHRFLLFLIFFFPLSFFPYPFPLPRTRDKFLSFENKLFLIETKFANRLMQCYSIIPT